MRTIVALVLLVTILTVNDRAAAAALNASPAGVRLAQANSGRMCAQVISCGTKNGMRKEYPTPCAAADDGATNITPRTGLTCEDSK
jgi:hypothetical protein